nr:hypothetical protein [uncultured Pedobacter sp.]
MKNLMLRISIFLFFMLLYLDVSAQLIKGKIIDMQTERPLGGISIQLKYTKKMSGVTGDFSLIASVTDTVWFSGLGYERRYVLVKDWKPPIMTIALTPTSLDLEEVVIFGQRNHKADSLKLRKDFAREFNYKPIGIKDVFINSYQPRGRFEFVKIDVLQLVRLLGRKNDIQNKLKKRLYEDEKQAYIDSRFGRSFVSSLTKLEGDSLDLFIEQYRPYKEELLELSDYNLMLKIKSDLKVFKEKKN